MTEILPGVHAIDGIDPSPDFTTNVLLLKDAKGGTWTLLDTGLPKEAGYDGGPAIVERYCAQHSIPLGSIRRIVITHLHLDHTGGLGELARKTGARIFAHWIEAAFIAKDPPYEGPGMPPKEAIQVHEKLKDGDTLDSFEGLVAYHSPGHTPGHTSYYCPARKILFAGDAVFNTGGKLVVSLKEYTFSSPLAQISVRRLAGLPVESVIQYHGAPVLKGGGKLLSAAAGHKT